MTSTDTTALAADSSPRHVSVSASGTVSAIPDQASVSTGVHTDAETAADALKANSMAMRNLIDGLKGLGIAARDIQTSNFQVHPRYENRRDGKPPKIVGYSAQNGVEILVRDVAQVGQILDKAVQLGANQASGVRFIVSKAETLLDEARRQAMVNARRRAMLYAEAAGAKIGQVLSVSEQQHGGGQPVFRGRAAMAAEAVPIEQGTQTLTATVNVSWLLE